MKVHMKHFQKNAISKILNNTHMEICPPENVQFPGIFKFTRALFKMEGSYRGGRKRLPKFKFSAKFPIGLHVILQIQIKKFENDCYLMWKIILTENPSRCNLAPLLK